MLWPPPIQQRIGARLVLRRVGERPLPLLHPLPERVVDDAQVGHLLDDPFALRVEARDPLAGVRVLDEALPVPDQPADVELVVQQAGAALRVAVDRVGPQPSPTGRARRPGSSPGDRPRRLAGGVLAEDAADDLRFGSSLIVRPPRTGLPAAPIRAIDSVAVARPPPPCRPRSGRAGRAASCRQILEEQRVHRTLEADVQLADLALGQGDDPHAGKAQPLVQRRCLPDRATADPGSRSRMMSKRPRGASAISS